MIRIGDTLNEGSVGQRAFRVASVLTDSRPCNLLSNRRPITCAVGTHGA